MLAIPAQGSEVQCRVGSGQCGVRSVQCAVISEQCAVSSEHCPVSSLESAVASLLPVSASQSQSAAMKGPALILLLVCLAESQVGNSWLRTCQHDLI